MNGKGFFLTAPLATVVLAVPIGCGGGTGDRAAPVVAAEPTGPAREAAPAPAKDAGALEVTAFTASGDALAVRFSAPIDRASVDGAVAVVQDADTDPGGRFDRVTDGGALAVDADGLGVTWTAAVAFEPGREVRLLLGAAIAGADGRALAGGAGGAPVSFPDALPGGVAFEARHLPEPPGAGLLAPPPDAAAARPTAAATGAFYVVDASPSLNSDPTGVSEIRILFSNPVNPSTARGPTQSGTTFAFLVDTDTTPGGSYNLMSGQLLWEQGYQVMLVRTASALTPGHQVLVVLTSGLRDEDGRSLQSSSISGSLSARGVWPSQVFENRFVPRAATAAPSPTPSPAPTPTPAPAPQVPDPDDFTLKSGTDYWFIDFDLRASKFREDMSRHGLLSGDADVDGPTWDRVVHQVLATVSLKYRRRADGTSEAGRSYKISFTKNRPSGTPGWHFSRMAMGGSLGGGTLGVAYLDPGNRRREDNARSDMGVFTNSIWGRYSYLRTRLRSSDERYVDGTYRLGDGGSSADSRFRAIRNVIADWGQSIGTILAHEVGHSVGLDHVDSSRNIMSSSASAYMMSDPDLAFTSGHLGTLTRNLGKH